jgi:hypothetical protein
LSASYHLTLPVGTLLTRSSFGTAHPAVRSAHDERAPGSLVRRTRVVGSPSDTGTR